MEYIRKKVIVDFSVVVADWNSGDFVRLFTNSGSGEIDWEVPIGGRIPLITPQTPIAGGIATVRIDTYVNVPGTWKLGVKVWDRFNNVQVGDSPEASAYIDLVPLFPAGMEAVSFDYENSELVLGL